MPTIIRTLGLAVSAVVLGGCDVASTLSDRAEAVVLRRIEPVRSEFGYTGRSLLQTPAGDCIILHYPPRSFNEFDTTDLRTRLADVLAGDPNTAVDDGALVVGDYEPWTVGSDGELSQNTFNCCTFAVGDVVGLSKLDWIAPNATGDTEEQSPMLILLRGYYDLVQRHQYINWQSLTVDETLQHDDVVCFMRTYLQTGGRTQVVHTGRVLKVDGTNWLVSKFGSGPIVRTTLEAMAAQYASQFDELRVYRVKPEFRRGGESSALASRSE